MSDLTVGRIEVDLDELRWYLRHSNHGRGRVTGVSGRLLRRGLLRQQWTSMTCWVLTLTVAGRKALIQKAEQG